LRETCRGTHHSLTNQIGTNIATAIPELPAVPTAALNTSSDTYTTAKPEQLYSLLTATAPTKIDGTVDLRETAPDPADYSLVDIEEIIMRIRKWHGRAGTLVLESMEENAEALRRMVRARDAVISPQTITKPTAAFESDTATPAPIPTPIPIPALAPAPVPIPVLPLALTTATYPNIAVTTRATLVIKAETVNLHKTTQHDSEESEGMGRDKISEKQNAEESIEKGEQETQRRIDEERVVKNKDMKAICTQIDKDDATHHQSTPFDWATDVDVSFGPVPTSFVDCAPAECASCTLTTRTDCDDLIPSVGNNKPTYITTNNPAPILPPGHAPIAFLAPAPRVPRDLSTLRSNTPNQNPKSRNYKLSSTTYLPQETGITSSHIFKPLSISNSPKKTQTQ
jgi:hypothetical protein